MQIDDVNDGIARDNDGCIKKEYDTGNNGNASTNDKLVNSIDGIYDNEDCNADNTHNDCENTSIPNVHETDDTRQDREHTTSANVLAAPIKPKLSMPTPTPDSKPTTPHDPAANDVELENPLIKLRMSATIAATALTDAQNELDIVPTVDPGQITSYQFKISALENWPANQVGCVLRIASGIPGTDLFDFVRAVGPAFDSVSGNLEVRRAEYQGLLDDVQGRARMESVRREELAEKKKIAEAEKFKVDAIHGV